MRCYKIEAINNEGYIAATRYAGTNAEARQCRDQMVETIEGITKKDVSIDPTEIPTAKGQLLDWVNELMAAQDLSNVEEGGE